MKIDDKVVRAICSSIMTRFRFAETMSDPTTGILEMLEEPGQFLVQKELRRIRKAQRLDPLLERWRRFLIDRAVPSTYMRGKHLSMKKQFQNLFVKRW